LPERPGFEQVANLWRRPVPVIRKTFNNDRHFVRREPLIHNLLERDLFVRQPCAFLDRALDRVARHRTLARLLHRRCQTRVQIRVSSAQFRRDHDFADELHDHLPALLRVGFASGLFPLCAH
jgi:hypothetical protein